MKTPLRRYAHETDLYVDFTNGESSLADLVITHGGPYFRKLAIWLQSHLWLLLLGIASELVYYFYLLRNFPVMHDYYHLDTMGGIAGYTHAGLLTYLIAFSSLFVLFGFAWWETRRFQDHTTLWIILSFGGIFALTTMFVYPVTAIDIFNYIAYGLLLVQHHANPMITPPSRFIADPLMGLAGGFIDQPSPYGPLGQLIQALPVAIGGRNILASLLLLKFMSSGMLVISAFFVYKILFPIKPEFALPGVLALAWNPFALFEFCANGHNDIVMMLLIILAIFTLRNEHPVWALTLITASALIKFASLPLIPLFFIYSYSHQPTLRKRIVYTIEASICSAVLAFICFAPFWAGPQTFARFFSEIGYQKYSFSNFLQDSSSGHISLQQAKVIGWALFGNCFIYAFWLSSKDFSGLLKGCYITMFALLALSVTYIQPWYLIWPFVFAILIPQTRVSLAAILLTYCATLAELGQAYIFTWGPNKAGSIVINSSFYLIIFFPPTLFLLVSRFSQIFSQPSSLPHQE
ncbi:MAG TPA: hypothetical protein VHV10_08275 [Ktedonobacteraceae bacterium]|nr:hypothetical protein [Ktedonobacteraceae bacterium]